MGAKIQPAARCKPIHSGRHMDQELQPLYLNNKNIYAITRKATGIGLLGEIFFVFSFRAYCPLLCLSLKFKLLVAL